MSTLKPLTYVAISARPLDLAAEAGRPGATLRTVTQAMQQMLQTESAPRMQDLRVLVTPETYRNARFYRHINGGELRSVSVHHFFGEAGNKVDEVLAALIDLDTHHVVALADQFENSQIINSIPGAQLLLPERRVPPSLDPKALAKDAGVRHQYETIESFIHFGHKTESEMSGSELRRARGVATSALRVMMLGEQLTNAHPEHVAAILQPMRSALGVLPTDVSFDQSLLEATRTLAWRQTDNRLAVPTNERWDSEMWDHNQTVVERTDSDVPEQDTAPVMGQALAPIQWVANYIP